MQSGCAFIFIRKYQGPDMQRKNTSAGGIYPASSASRQSNPPAEPESAENINNTSQFDFLSAEFNVIDDLDDNIGNYREFQTLDGVVTADMRHHEKRKRVSTPRRENPERVPEKNDRVGSREKTLSQESFPPVTIISRGRLLIIGPDLEHILDCGEFLIDQGLECTLCLLNGDSREPSISRTSSLAYVETQSVSVSGCLGAFSALAVVDGDRFNLSTRLGNESGFFDLILDLQTKPSFTGKQLPVGYYAPGESKSGLDEALSELPEMRGRFHKPQFTLFRENLCLHGRSRVNDCRKCLEICPVSAIDADIRKIVIDAYQCQGCGACTLVCPADAIRMQNPSRDELLSEIFALLSEEITPGSPPPDVIIHERMPEDKSFRNADGFPGDRLIMYQVEDIARIGLDVLLAVLAYGAGRVLLFCPPESPVEIREALEKQVVLGRTVLAGLDLPADRIRFNILPQEKMNIPAKETCLEDAQSARPLSPPAVFPAGQDKRHMIRLAASYLLAASGSNQPCIPMPEDGQFGAVCIDTDACSLCMTCTGTCPTGALSAGGDTPLITFTEALCHQCGLCREVCPENAIQLAPRLLCDMEAADNPDVLKRAEPFHCVECGVPFASPDMIQRMVEKLEGHWMYGNDRQIRRLKMCRTCRTRDALTAGDYQS